MAHEFVAARDAGRDEFRAVVIERSVDQRRCGKGEVVEEFEAAPCADPVAIFAPSVIEHVGLGRGGADVRAHALAEGEMLDVEADVDRKARAVGPAIIGAPRDRAIVEPPVCGQRPGVRGAHQAAPCARRIVAGEARAREQPFGAVVPDLHAHDQAVADHVPVHIAIAFERGAVRPCAVQCAQTVDNRPLRIVATYGLGALDALLDPGVPFRVESRAFGRIMHLPPAGEPDREIGRGVAAGGDGIGDHQQSQVFVHDLGRGRGNFGGRIGHGLAHSLARASRSQRTGNQQAACQIVYNPDSIMLRICRAGGRRWHGPCDAFRPWHAGFPRLRPVGAADVQNACPLHPSAFRRHSLRARAWSSRRRRACAGNHQDRPRDRACRASRRWPAKPSRAA